MTRVAAVLLVLALVGPSVVDAGYSFAPHSLRPRPVEERATTELIFHLRETLSSALDRQLVAQIPHDVLIQLALAALEDASDDKCTTAIKDLLNKFSVNRGDASRIFSALRNAITAGRITPFFITAGIPEGYDRMWPRNRKDAWIGENARDPVKMAIRHVFAQIFKRFNIYPDPGKTIVDIGARTGWLEKLLGKNWADVITMFDRNEIYLSEAREQGVGKAHVAGDVYELKKSFGNIYLVLSIETFDTFLDLDRAVLQCHDALAPGGVMVIVQAAPVQVEPLIRELAEQGVAYSPYYVEFFDSEEKRKQAEALYKQWELLSGDAPEDSRKAAWNKFVDAKESLRFNTGNYFREKLTRALSKTGFEILLSQGVRGSYAGPKEERHRSVNPSANVFAFFGGTGDVGYDARIPLNVVVEEVGAQVVVVRKNRTKPETKPGTVPTLNPNPSLSQV